MLRMEQSKVDNQFIRLMNDLQLSLQQDEDLTVILADAFADGDEHRARDEAEKKEDDAAASIPARPRAEERNDTVDIQKPNRLEQKLKAPETVSRPNFVCFAGDVFSGYSLDSSEREEQRRTTAGTASPTGSLEGASSLFPSASHPSPSALRAGARAWREQHGQAPRDGIDFRTGMSGHMALLSSHAHPHEYLEEPSYSASSAPVHFPKMSSHTGLTMPRLSGIMASLTLPSFGTARPSTEERREEVHQSGSM